MAVPSREKRDKYYCPANPGNSSTCHPLEDICQQRRIEEARARFALEDLHKRGLIQLGNAGAWCLTEEGLAKIQEDCPAGPPHAPTIRCTVPVPPPI